jgi:putative sigma-54 modulation protein
MQISMTFRHMDPSDAMKELVEDKVARVRKYLQGPIDASVVLSMERYLHVCDVTISSGGQTFKGREESDDMYTSIDRVMEKIERQIDRVKGRYRSARSS